MNDKSRRNSDNLKRNSSISHFSTPFLERLAQPKNREFKIKEQKTHNINISLHPTLHDFHTIKWLRKRIGEHIIKKSIISLLPNNGIAAEKDEEEISGPERRRNFIETYLKKVPKSDFTINPNYFFSINTVNKIMKLKDIFIEFDEDLSRKLELVEMVEMFNQNNILLEDKNLCELFFPEIDTEKISAEKMEQLYFDFYEFMQYALSTKSDQSFRNFMRKIKQNLNQLHNLGNLSKQREEGFYKNIQWALSDKISNGLEIPGLSLTDLKKANEERAHEFDKQSKFLPMNFNLVLDYFNKKGKVRENEKKINTAIVSCFLLFLIII